MAFQNLSTTTVAYLNRTTKLFDEANLYTMCCWARKDAGVHTGSGQYALMAFGDGTNHHTLEIRRFGGDDYDIYWSTHTTLGRATIQIETGIENNWVFYAVRYTGGGAGQVFLHRINLGRHTNTELATAAGDNFAPANNRFRIGCRSQDAVSWWNGRIFNVKIWAGRSLTQEELYDELYQFEPVHHRQNVWAWMPMVKTRHEIRYDHMYGAHHPPWGIVGPSVVTNGKDLPQVIQPRVRKIVHLFGRLAAGGAIALSGTIAGAASATPAPVLDAGQGLTGTIAGVSAATPAPVLDAGQALVGTIPGSSDATPAPVLDAGQGLQGSVGGQGGSTAPVLAVSRPLDGTIPGQSGSTPPILAVQRPLAGTIPGLSALDTAILNLSLPLAGTIAGLAGVATADLTLSGEVTLSGTIAAVSSLDPATLDAGHGLAGAVVAAAGSSAVLDAGQALVGTIAAVSSSDPAVLDAGQALVGTIVVLSGLDPATLDVTSGVVLSGTIAAVSGSSSPVLSLAQPLAGTIAAQSGESTPTLELAIQLSGTIAGVSALSPAELLGVLGIFIDGVGQKLTPTGDDTFRPTGDAQFTPKP